MGPGAMGSAGYRSRAAIKIELQRGGATLSFRPEDLTVHWLLTYPENGPTLENYRRWLARDGVETTCLDAAYSHPGDISRFDALLLPGGGDVDPACYRAERHPKTDGVLEARDRVELQLIAEFRAIGRPVFGICRGLQILNVACGGSLIQHVPDQVATDAEEHVRPAGEDAAHTVRRNLQSRLGSVLHEAGDSNSSHHQSVDPERVGAGLRIAAWSGEGIVEAVESIDPSDRLSAVQWHPERMDVNHPASAALRAHWCRIVRGA